MKRPPKGRAPAQPKKIALPRLAILRRKPYVVSLFETVEAPLPSSFGPPAPPLDWQMPLPFPPEGGQAAMFPPRGGHSAPIAQGSDPPLGGPVWASTQFAIFFRSVVNLGQLQSAVASPCTFQPQGPALCTLMGPTLALVETPLAAIAKGFP